ncbi:MAG: Gx transporter family protein [Oscillospiraceae bacterium]|nr:Gx transporter family protein [Oscillospiraceae bacterium]
MKNSKIAQLALLTALALILSYIEALIPLPFGVPGIKLGLANIAVVFTLFKLTAKDAVIVSIIRVVIASLLFGTFASFIYSLSGAVLSLAVMSLLKRSEKFSPTGVSVAGGVMHNLGQLAAAAFMLGTGRLMWYFPVLCISGIAAGVIIGLLSGLIIKRLESY